MSGRVYAAIVSFVFALVAWSGVVWIDAQPAIAKPWSPETLELRKTNEHLKSIRKSTNALCRYAKGHRAQGQPVYQCGRP